MARLPANNTTLTAHAAAQAVGYGQTKVETVGPTKPAAQNTDAPDVAIKKMGGVTVDKVFATELRLSDGNLQKDPRPCHGDSGGPLVVRANDGTPQLSGVASRGGGTTLADADACVGMTYTRVDVLDSWIAQSTADQSSGENQTGTENESADKPKKLFGCQEASGAPAWALVLMAGAWAMRARKREEP